MPPVPRLARRNDWRALWLWTLAASLALVVAILVVACGNDQGAAPAAAQPDPTAPPTSAPPADPPPSGIDARCGTVQPTGACPSQGLAGQDLANVCRCADAVNGGFTPGAMEPRRIAP